MAIAALAGVTALLGGFAILFGIIALFGFAIIIIAKWVIFTKAGKGGWEAIVPIYNTWILVEIAGLKWYFFLGAVATIVFGAVPGIGSLAGLVALFAYFSINYNLAIKFGKEPIGYGIGLTLLPIVFYPMLAFSSNSKYSDVKVSEYGPIPEEKIDASRYNNTNSTGSNNFCKNCGAPVNGEKFCSKCGTKQN